MTLNSHGNALPEGYRLLWYRIGRVLGQGGFGITYEAFDTNLEKPVAIKEYLPKDFAVRETDTTVRPFTEDRKQMFDWGLDRFLQEARTLAKFHHPNIVLVHNVFEENGTAYMVMEFEQGEALDRLFKLGRLKNENDLLRILHPLLDGLEHMHQAGFIHRDIKPPNIYVRLDGTPVLIDFGSARFAIGGETKTLTSLVSPGFAPYEQYNVETGKQGPWTDIYGLGATLYAGINRGRGPMDAIVRGHARIEGKPDPMSSAVEIGQGQYSLAFLQAIDAALGFTPAERPATVAQWRDMMPGLGIESTTAEAPASISQADIPTVISKPGEPDVATKPRKDSHYAKWIVIAFLFVGTIAGGIYVAQNWTALLSSLSDQTTAVEQQGIEEAAKKQAMVAEQQRAQQLEQARLAREEEERKKNEMERLARQKADEERVRLEQERIRQAKAEAASRRQKNIDQLLAKAGKALVASRLTSPVGDNAMEYFQSILEIDENNAQAKQGIGRVVARYLELADSASQQEQWVKARVYINKAYTIDPGNDAVLIARENLAQLQRQAEKERQRRLEEERQRRELEDIKRAEVAKREKFNSLLSQARQATNDENFNLATSQYDQALALYPNDQTGLAGKAEVARLREQKICMGILGKWFVQPNARTWTVRKDHTVFGTWLIFSSTGQWQCLSARERKFHFSWPQCSVCASESLILSEDGNTIISTMKNGSTGTRMNNSP